MAPPSAPPAPARFVHLLRLAARALSGHGAVRTVSHRPATRPAAVAEADATQAALVPGPPGPPARPAAPPSRAGLDSYQGRVRAAIQGALRYPPAAAMMASDGRARVAFVLLDARADGIRLVQGSGTPQLDTAALAAVREAAYPRPPAELAGQAAAMLVWVEFRRPDAGEE